MVLFDRLRERFEILVLRVDPCHHLNKAIEAGAPLVWCSSRSQALRLPTKPASISRILRRSRKAALSMKRGWSKQRHVSETGQGSALSADAHLAWTSRRSRRGRRSVVVRCSSIQWSALRA